MLYGIAFRSKQTGHISYYTGKAGGDWLSPNREDTFFGYSLEGVSYIGGRMLRTPLLDGRMDLIAVDPKDEQPNDAFDSEGGLTD